MKNSTGKLRNTLCTAAILISVIFSAYAQNKSKTSFQVPVQVKNIKMIVVTGNIKVCIVQNQREAVYAYDYGEKDMLTCVQRGGKLFLNSTDPEPITVYVWVKDLTRIEASDNSRVKTIGKMELKALQVFLHDKAQADLTINCESVYTLLKDRSSLKMGGRTDYHILSKDKISKIGTTQLVSLKTDTLAIESELAINNMK